MPRAILVVFTNPIDESREDEFNDWYTNVHLHDILKIPGYVAATRYRLADAQLAGAAPPKHRYLAIYEIETDDLDATVKALSERAAAGDMYITDALDRANASAHFYVQLTERLQSVAASTRHQTNQQ